MRFLLAFVLSFVSVFAIAQAPPMTVGGPQGINVTRILTQSWMSTPIYTDTPVTPLTGFGWPGRGYLITVVRNETPCQNCPPKDTTLWMYTGARWKRVGYDYLTRLIYGAEVAKTQNSNFNYTIQPYGAFFDGDYKIGSNVRTATLTNKASDSTSRIDVLVLNRDSFQVKTGVAARVPKKPIVTGSEVEIASFYFKAFDTVPVVTTGSPAISNIFRIAGRDSIYYTINNQTFAIKDSLGITKNDTAAMLNNYKFTAANGLTKDSTVFRLGGTLNQNTNINLDTRRLSIVSLTDTTRFFSNGRVSIGGTPDSSFMLNVNGNQRIAGQLTFNPPQNTSQIRITAGIVSAGGNSTQNSLISIGRFAGNQLTSSGGENLVAIGENAGGNLTSGGRYSVIIGRNAGTGITTGESNTIIGAGDAGNLPSNTSNVIHLVAGDGYEINRADTALLGLTSRYAFIGGGFNFARYINDFYLGAGHRVRDPQLAHINLYAPSGFPTKVDDIGSNFTINAGRGTGTGAGGSIIFRTSQATTSGTTLQTLTERARISPTGSLLVNRQSQLTADTIYKLDVNGSARIDGKLNFATRDIKIGTNASGASGVIAIGQQDAVDNYSKVGTGRAILIGFGNGNNWGTVGNNDISIGQDNKLSTTGSANGSIQIGTSLRSSGSSTLIGSNANDNGFNVISIDRLLPPEAKFNFTANNQTYIRGQEYFLGTAGTDSVNVTINGNRASSSNKSGGNITIAGGMGNGNATPGAVIFSTSTRLPNAADTTTLQTLSERARISERGNLLVGTSTDDTSSLVNIVSTTKGFLQPRMSSIQRDAITTPATGLQLFNTTDSANYVYRGTGGGWQKIANEISGSATLDFPSTNNGNKSDLTINGITGAEEGDVVALGIQNSVNLNHSCFTAWVSAANTVTVRFSNYGTGSLDPVSATFKVKVFK